jgi:hypothetical protein
MVVLASLIVLAGCAQTAKAPEAYSVTEVNTMMGPSMTMKIDRDGAHAVVEATITPQPGAAPSTTRTYYDLQNHKNYTLSLSDAAAVCSRGDFSGDWGDPFEMSAALMKELAPKHPREIGAETLNGFATTVMETDAGPDQAKFWLDTNSGLAVKVQKGSQTIVEIKRLSLDKPPAALFAVPAKCGDGPPTRAEQIGLESGGNPDDFVDATRAQSAPNTCPVVFRAVHAGTMAPITSGFQLALDRTADENSALYDRVHRRRPLDVFRRWFARDHGPVAKRCDAFPRSARAILPGDRVRKGWIGRRSHPSAVFRVAIGVAAGSEESRENYRWRRLALGQVPQVCFGKLILVDDCPIKPVAVMCSAELFGVETLLSNDGASGNDPPLSNPSEVASECRSTGSYPRPA